ncbi:hypothetical protein HK405_005660 [Cladochytrium tenue]|nr:hypothetical protein HK405_005660 [Cladochytrium tenue]
MPSAVPTSHQAPSAEPAQPDLHPPPPMRATPHAPLTFDQLVARSDAFHSRVPFQSQANRIATLADPHRSPAPLSPVGAATASVADAIAADAAATHVVLHSKVLALIDDFLALKLCSGSRTERAVYQRLGWSARALVERLFLRRALMFAGGVDTTIVVRFGPPDAASGEREILGVDEIGPALPFWGLVGSDHEDPRLKMEDYLTYQEMQLSALIGVSVPTYFINQGQRNNRAVPADPARDPFVPHGVYLGLVGARFHNALKMEREYCFVEAGQSTPEQGFGPGLGRVVLDSAAQTLRAVRRGSIDASVAADAFDSNLANAARMHMWARFLDLPADGSSDIPGQDGSYLPAFQSSLAATGATDAATATAGAFLPLPGFWNEAYLNIAAYHARIRITAETLLMEASDRAAEAAATAGTAAPPPVYVHVVGLGLGVWQVHHDQPALYVRAFGDAILSLARNGRIPHVAVVDFSWVPGPTECAGAAHGQRVRVDGGSGGGFGPEIRFSRRNPADPLPRPPPCAGASDGGAAEYLLVACYAWDSNSFPGNEYWSGSLSSSGDPAAVCCSTVGELQNPYVNPFVANSMRVLDPVAGSSTI